MENLYYNGWFGGTTILGNTHIENPKLIRYDDFDLHLVGCNH